MSTIVPDAILDRFFGAHIRYVPIVVNNDEGDSSPLKCSTDVSCNRQ